MTHSLTKLPDGDGPYDAGAVALVTGATSGIGLEIARQLIGHDITVWVGARDPHKGRAVASQLGGGAGEPRAHIDFYQAGYPRCPAKTLCTTAAYRGITLRTREQHELLETRRREQHTDKWELRYNTRAGVEGTMSQAVCRNGVRRARYRGLEKTRLEHVLTATALDLLRLDARWTGTPLAPTRTSHYEQLALALAA